jgi:hypothetical protein
VPDLLATIDKRCREVRTPGHDERLAMDPHEGATEPERVREIG